VQEASLALGIPLATGTEKTDRVLSLSDPSSRNMERDLNDLDTLLSEVKKLQDLRAEYDSSSSIMTGLTQESRKEMILSGGLEMPDPMEFCCLITGTIERELSLPAETRHPPLFLRTMGNHVLGLTLKRHRQEVLDLLAPYGFRQKDTSAGDGARWAGRPPERISNEIISAERSLENRRAHIAGWLAGLQTLYYRLHLMAEAEKKILHTGDTVFISGWIDLTETEKLLDLTRKTCGREAYLRIYSRMEMLHEGEAIPVRLRNFGFFRAFERIIKNAGMPGDPELDPTPVAAPAYLLMFGAMFGDAGQGAVLVLAGLLMRFLAKRRKAGAFMKDAGSIVTACGLSASVFGMAYGSMFGSESIIPALYFHPMENVGGLFFSVIMMGALLISLSMTLNILNLISSGGYFDALFSGRGLLGLFAYAGCLIMIARYVIQDIMPSWTELAVTAAMPSAIFMARSIPGRLFFGWKGFFPGGIFEYLVESVMQLLEMFTGFLGNSISFIRAGAFALAHAGLGMALYTLAGIAGPIPSISSIPVIVAGNIFIILLEGLLCGIQAMRLEYYEFFSRFFHGNGIEFSPFSFKIEGKETGR
jgi:V/A-type H+-transporting ATPase subunit I